MAEISEPIFSEILIKKGLLTPEALEECLKIQESCIGEGHPKDLEQILREQNLVRGEDIIRVKNFMVAQKDLNIQGYLLIKKIGEGGMGEVYKGTQLSLNRTVAIKFLDPELGKNQSFLQRFIQEARALAQLNHKNIVKGIDFGESEGIYYYVMEYLKGRNMEEIVEKKGPLREKTVLNIVLQMAYALDYIAQQHFVHRDIKPENILLCTDGTAKLCDLGLAKWHKCNLSLTTVGAIVGTPYYLSPEQAQGKSDVDIRSDIYSLGASAYFMLSGKPPYKGEKATVIHFRHIYDPPPKITDVRPDLSSHWDDFFMRIMAKDVEQRIQSPKQLIQIIAKLSQMPVSTAKKTQESFEEDEKEVEETSSARKTSIQKSTDIKEDTISLRKKTEPNATQARPASRKSTRKVTEVSRSESKMERIKSLHSTQGEKHLSAKQKMLLAIGFVLFSLLALALGIALRVWTK